MKKYIMINHGINGVGGGQIYAKNKAQYMEDKGYEVYMLFSHKGYNIAIKYLEKFKDGYFPELELNLACLTQKQIKKTINKILEFIKYNDGNEVIVESNMLYLSMWGEELAKRVNGKHIIFSISERNKIDRSNLEYIEFKYLRGELASINQKAFCELYEKSSVIPNCGVKKLTAFLGDPVEEYDVCEIDNLKLKDKNICIMGRMSKLYVISSCEKISEYVRKYPKIQFFVMVLGLKNENIISQINSLFANCSNIQVNIMDSIFPIPKKLFSMFDLIIGGSGCASLSYRQGALTLCMDIHNGNALGLMGYDIVKSFDENPYSKDFDKYLDEALFTKEYENRDYVEPDFSTKEKCFLEHDDFYSNSDKIKEYYDFSVCAVSKKEKIKTMLYLLFGIKRVKYILKFLFRLFKSGTSNHCKI